MVRWVKTPYAALAAMALLCVLAYWRALSLPFISDDYLQIRLARDFGPVSGWSALAADALYRCRATSLVLTYWTERVFGPDPFVFNCSSLLLHILNTWLIFAFGVWRLIGWRASAAAACFFAVYHGHQEAVIWYAALPELLVFFFAASSFLLFLLWLRSGTSHSLYLASLAAFLLALLSKESAIAVSPLLLLALLVERKSLRRFLIPLLPFVLLSIVYFAISFAARRHHLHYNDGTFSLHAPFYWIEFRSIIRLLWVCGFAGLAALALWPASRWNPLLKISAAWILCTLLPYCFLTYMPFVPSRHTYLASAGLSFLIAAAFLTFAGRFPRPALVCSLAALILISHCAYIWTRKQRQFLERAAPTELLIRYARHAPRGPIRLHCFPYHISIAQLALDIRLGPGYQAELVNQHASLDLCPLDPKHPPGLSF
ncbi:MAG: hypothetical protein IANPNBLG_01387 [Bryobacteraceae bacterium]|nr:hypothetical protein [Bryobacteraceae bacterium]